MIVGGRPGRGMHWDPDQQAIEQERQRWAYERVSTTNELIADLMVDPDREYEQHIEEYVRTGDLLQLNLALEYVQCPA